MSILKKAAITLACLAFFAVGAHASAANVYLSQSGGTFSGGSACNGQSTQAYTFFNNSGNWGNGGSQIGPGTTVWICGTITCPAGGASGLTFQGSGASGNPVVLKFDNGGDLACSWWGSNAYTGGPGAITCSGQNYVTVDGGTNGIVENTSNGTSLANQQNSTGVFFQDCGNPTIQNLTIRNIYVKTNVSDENEFGVGLWLVGGNNWLVTNNSIMHGVNGMNLGWDASGVTVSNNVVSYNTIDYGCHLINGPGDGNGGLSGGGFVLDHNTIGPHMSIWQDPAQYCHGDGIGPLGAGITGSSLNGLTISNNLITSDMCALGGNCTALIFPSGATNLQIFNNVLAFVNVGNGSGSGESLIRLAGNGVPEINPVIYNNTLIGPTGSQTGIKMDAAVNLIAKNNIFVNLGQAWLDNTGGNFSQFASVASVNYNDYYNMAYNIGSGNIHYASFSAWQAAGFDPNSTTGNPALNSSYMPQSGSAALTLGANLSSPSNPLDYDRAGLLRPPTGPWSAGVYQSTSSLPAPPANVTAVVQ